MNLGACDSSFAGCSGSFESEVASEDAEQGLGGVREPWYWCLAGEREITPELALPDEDISHG